MRLGYAKVAGVDVSIRASGSSRARRLAMKAASSGRQAAQHRSLSVQWRGRCGQCRAL